MNLAAIKKLLTAELIKTVTERIREEAIATLEGSDHNNAWDNITEAFEQSGITDKEEDAANCLVGLIEEQLIAHIQAFKLK